MNKLISLLLSLLLLSSCGPGVSEHETYKSVRARFPAAKLYHMDGNCLRWFVINPDGITYIVKTGSMFSSEVTSIKKVDTVHISQVSIE